jgi:hypothetical protein
LDFKQRPILGVNVQLGARATGKEYTFFLSFQVLRAGNRFTSTPGQNPKIDYFSVAFVIELGEPSGLQQAWNEIATVPEDQTRRPKRPAAKSG